MTAKVQLLVNTFDALPDRDKYEAAVEILRRSPLQGDIPEAALIKIADDLFQALDAAEGENAAP
jgi:hypothetical protein